MPGFNDHVPEEWLADSKKAERSFFYAVLMTLAPEYLEQLVLDIRQQRLGAAQEKLLQPRQINIAPGWIEPLLAQPFIPCKYLFLLTAFDFLFCFSLTAFTNTDSPFCFGYRA